MILNDQIENDKMCRMCSTQGGFKKLTQKYGLEYVKVRDHLGGLGIDRKI
jgi:hypothetical protein